MPMKYMPRVIDRYLDDSLESAGAVLIEGAKWCGKTSAAKEKARSVLFMQDPDHTNAYLNAADTKPSLLLAGETPRLFDDWQMAPVLWDVIRHTVDMRGKTGQYILTGSAAPVDNMTRHTGTGRISRILMRPMSLFESGESTGTVSLKKLFDGEVNIEGFSSLTIEKLAFALVRGGWPATIGQKERIALRRAYDYVDAVINYDVSKVDEIEKNPARVRTLMRSYARNIATMANISVIKNDMAEDENVISEKTIASYINALRRIYVIEDIPAWNPALRSKTALRTTSKRCFVDPSIASAVMRLTPQSILEDFNTFGYLFESLCVRDLRVYSQIIDGAVYHYRDKSGLEADSIVHLNDGRWGAIEVKLGAKEIEEAAKHLKTLRDRVDANKMKEPSFLMVLTGTEYAYKREDGVLIVPIGCLRD